MKNFKLILTGIDPGPLLRQMVDNPQLWNNDNEWKANKAQTVLYAQNNITLRRIFPPFPGVPPFRNFDAFSILSASHKIVFDVMRAIPGEILAQVVISRMAPGEVIEPHIDRLPAGFPLSYHRYQIPLSVKPGVSFVCGDEDLYMEPGNVYWFDNQVMHSVHNNSDEDRLSMRIDARPFDVW